MIESIQTEERLDRYTSALVLIAAVAASHPAGDEAREAFQRAEKLRKAGRLEESCRKAERALWGLSVSWDRTDVGCYAHATLTRFKGRVNPVSKRC
jgi:hypothetical protein